MHDVTLEQARQIIALALRQARQLGLQPMSVVVVDAAGQLKCAQREDGATSLRTDIALGKAGAALQMGVSSRVLGERARDLPVFFGALAALGQGRFVPHAGAVLIREADGRVLGAVGASGGSGAEDEAICITGVLASGLHHG